MFSDVRAVHGGQKGLGGAPVASAASRRELRFPQPMIFLLQLGGFKLHTLGLGSGVNCESRSQKRPEFEVGD
jgi:hypothetical protein